jgi:hypothetical protein
MEIDRRKVKKVSFTFLGCYWTIFIVYLILTRAPPYFTSPKARGIVAYVHHNQYHWQGKWHDRMEPVIHYIVGDSTYEYDNRIANYMRTFEKGEYVTIVYNASHPENAAIVSLIGYWASTDELMFSFLFSALIVSLITTLYTPKVEGGEEQSDEGGENSEEEYVVLPSNHWL